MKDNKGNNAEVIMDELKEKVKEALKATNIDDVYSVGMRNAFRYVISLIDGKEPQYEDCKTH